MEIKVLGSCCGNCDRVAVLVKEVVSEKGIPATVEKVTDVRGIVGYGVLRTPGLVIDGNVVMAGRVPSKEELGAWIGA
ncbi:MAG TPA: thioredoxin family protein [Chloroflexota bacterium]